MFGEDVKKRLRLLSEERLSPREVKTCVFVVPFLPLAKMVPGAGIEPARPYGQQILSLLRLPIPPSGRTIQFFFQLIGLVNTAGLM